MTPVAPGKIEAPPKFVLLTAAKNEGKYIGEALQSVLRQTVKPAAWFIMDDGSTDNTAQLVRDAAAQHPFIRLHSTGNTGGRSFGAKDKAINAAYEMARRLDFDCVGIQDADIAPEQADYYEMILKRFAQRPELGIAGGYIYERAAGVWACRKGNSPDSVAGGVQMFRRACYEQIGGYTPMHFGGEDWLAQLDARMAGWEVLACPEHPIHHYRPTSSADGRWRGLFRLGMMDASFGSHPVFEVLKCARRVGEKPLLIGSFIRLSGYLWWRLSGRAPLLPPHKVEFLRREQKAKMGRWKSGSPRLAKAGSV
jgi:glycosyltransferase involved in cell wall biosynthesis